MADTNEDAQVAPHIYYYSDPDESDKLLHHLPIPSFIDLSKYIETGKLWKVYNVDAPDKSMVDPVIEISGDGPHWVENDKNAQTAVIAQANEKIDQLDQAKQKLDKDLQAVQQAQTSATKQQGLAMQQNIALTKSITSLTKSQQASTQMMGTMQKLLLDIQQKVNAGASSNKSGGNK